MLHTVFSQCLLVELMQIWFGLRWRMRTVLTAIRVKLTQSWIAESYFLFLSTVYQHCADVGSGVQPQRHGQEELRGHSHAIEGCSHVSRVTCHVACHVSRHVSRVKCHASRGTPWYVSPAWHWNGPAVLVAAQDNDGASKAGKRRDQGRSWTPFFVSGG